MVEHANVSVEINDATELKSSLTKEELEGIMKNLEAAHYHSQTGRAVTFHHYIHDVEMLLSVIVGRELQSFIDNAELLGNLTAVKQ